MREEKNLFDKYINLSLEWNQKINITAITDFQEFYVKNVLDSLSLGGEPCLENAKRILDMGTGGGLPGVPLAIAYPDKEFILVDAVGKKLKVIDAVTAELGLTNVKTVHARAEDLAKDPEFKESFDLVVSRAVANMSTLSEYCLPFVKVGGVFCAYKTTTVKEEIDAAANAIKVLGGGPAKIVQSGQLGTDHIFVMVDKVKSTPKGYPRKAGLPSKDPL